MRDIPHQQRAVELNCSGWKGPAIVEEARFHRDDVKRPTCHDVVANSRPSQQGLAVAE
jgi:hypothetical protein